MQALILAGGKGTRLRPLTVYTPKPVVPIMNRPLLLYQIDVLRKAGITDVTLSLSYQPDKIEQIVGSGSDMGVNLRYITESSPMGTGGAYRFALEGSKQTTVVFNGDILTTLDVNKLLEFHLSKKAAATMAVVAVDDPAIYGVAQVDASDAVTRFIEKPGPDDLPGLHVDTINAGIYVLEPDILEAIPPNTNQSFEYDIFPGLLRDGGRFFGYTITKDYWTDIGTPDSYLAAHHDFLAGKIKGFDIEAVVKSDVATRAEIDNKSLIGPGCTIKSGARIVNSVIGAGVHIEEKAIIENSVVWTHGRISAGAEVRNSVLGRSCHIGRNATVGAGSVLGDKTTLTDYTCV
ncbi:MAG: sugar phosphate nucleotidyltransferase [Pyrinomonadaceae bacterium]